LANPRVKRGGADPTTRPNRGLTMSGYDVTYHLAPLEVWLSQAESENYLPEAFARDGFVHCTNGESQVLEAGNRYYTADPRPYCVLTIDVGRLTSPVTYGDADANRVFPHIQGPLNTDAVTLARSVLRSSDGRFEEVGDRLPES
jgi:uncharacterized protein (DUF952 family)